MHFIYKLQLTPHYRIQGNWDEETNKILEMHWNYLVGLHKEGVMQVVGKSDYGVEHPDNFGIAIFKAADAQAATDIMNNDPCVKHGVMTAEVHPFRLALMTTVPST